MNFAEFIKPKIVIIAVLVLVIAGGFFVFWQAKQGKIDLPALLLGSRADKLGAEAIDFINKNLLPPGTTATLVKITNEGSVYKIQIKIGNEEPDVYVSKDGKFLFTAAFEMKKAETKTSPAPSQELPKADRPDVKLFVMSYCPYGLQMEKVYLPVYQLLKDKVDWQPRYVIYQDYCAQASGDQKTTCEKQYCFKSGSETYCSMHGVAEINQDIREICAFQMGDLDKWWKFISAKNSNCTVNDIETCWKGQAQAAGLDTAKIESCFNSQKYTLAKVEIEEMAKYKATGSPMVFINDAEYNGGRAPEDYKKAICDSFDSAPSECQTSLGTTSTNTASGGCN